MHQLARQRTLICAVNKQAAQSLPAHGFGLSPRAQSAAICRPQASYRLASSHAFGLGLAFFFLLCTEAGFAQLATNVLGPRITFTAPIYDFGRVKSGEIVKHTYTFTNTGSELLEVTNVQPSCGCTTAGEWTRRIEPGQTGTIAVQFNSAGFGGEVLKTVTVSSTDKNQPTLILQLKGTVWKPIEVLPSFAVLNIMPDASAASTLVRITNNTGEYVSITSEPKCSTPAFAAQITTNQPGKAFQVEIRAVPPFVAGNSRATITLTTSSTNLPLVSIGVWSIVQPKLAVIPDQVTLPPAPIVDKTLPTVTIQNNSTNPVTIFDPVCSLTNVDIAFKEVMPGRAYTVTLAFPAGFEIPTGDPPMLTLKTSLPEQPLIKVAITHLPRATNSVSAARSP